MLKLARGLLVFFLFLAFFVFLVETWTNRQPNSASTNQADAVEPQVPNTAPTTTQTTPSYVPWSAVKSGEQQKESEAPIYWIGQQFSVGYWSYICHGIAWSSILASNPYSIQRANADFLIIDITARNDDRSSSTLPPFKLVDAEGRTYDQSSDAMLNPGFFSVLEDLNPGVSKRGRIAFDVPPERFYRLVVSGGIESGKQAMVTLPMRAVPKTEDDAPPVSYGR